MSEFIYTKLSGSSDSKRDSGKIKATEDLDLPLQARTPERRFEIGPEAGGISIASFAYAFDSFHIAVDVTNGMPK
jgi:hypothetical protein